MRYCIFCLSVQYQIKRTVKGTFPLINLTYISPRCLYEKPFKVSWVRHRDVHILTAGDQTFTSDQRYFYVWDFDFILFRCISYFKENRAAGNPDQN